MGEEEGHREWPCHRTRSGQGTVVEAVEGEGTVQAWEVASGA